MKKQISSLLLAMALILSLTAPAHAYSMQTEASSPVAMSLSHAAYLDGSGTLWMWGSNTTGELGAGNRESSSVPVRVMDGVTAVSLGNGVSAALKTDKSLWMWGSNYHGQLGTKGSGDVNIGGGNNADHASKHYIHTTPVKVMDDVASVQAGSYYTAAIKTDGSLWMWGDNQYGHIGNGAQGDRTDRYDYIYQTEPVKIMEQVSCVTFNEDAHTVAAVRTDGSLWMWGKNVHSELGNNGEGDKFYEFEEIDDIEVYQTTPIKVLDNVASVSLGANHSAAVKTDGSLWMWGSNFYGQLGSGSTTDSGVPIKVLDGVAAVDLGWSRTAALKTDGSLWTWGWNESGRLGNGSTVDAHLPVKIMDGVAAIGGYQDQAAALKTDGSLWTWGWNYYGQLGNGSTENSAVPVKVLDQVSAVSGHQGSMLALKTDGSLWAWGWNYYGQLGSGSTENSTVPVQIRLDAPAQDAASLQNASPFADVSRDAYYYEPVLWAVEKQITNGVTADAFAPGAVCTRGEIITFLWRAMGRPEPEPAPSPFSDVIATNFYYKPVLWAAEQDMASGSLFSPKSPCTRAETVSFLWRSAGSPEASAVTGFTDVGPSASCAQAVSWAVSNNIVTGTSDVTFSPGDTCTRGQIVTLLWRYLGK
ncbi:MAG: hypothetical protein HFF73_11775 [Oscillospiraceae bacterium]|nr:hypothetical protein [Oscillospiraceae bacterium]